MSRPCNPLRLLPALALLAATAAVASMPTGARFGRWHVVSISSLSGVAGDDASAVLVQETRGGTLQAEWDQGGPVMVSIDIEDCTGEDEDFSSGYRVPEAEWLALADGGAARLRTGFEAWLAEARRSCPRRVSHFRLDGLAGASRDFTARIRALRGG